MKRRTFRLGSVLRYYELQKSRSEYELHQASGVLQAIDSEIAQLGEEITATARILENGLDRLSVSGMAACYRKTAHLSNRLAAARTRRVEQAKRVAQLEQVRKRWAIAEETLLTLKRDATDFNRTELVKQEQLQLDETVLRHWIGLDLEPTEN